eukprot:2352171-Alexandrium_andersonii.AAC.1
MSASLVGSEMCIRDSRLMSAESSPLDERRLGRLASAECWPLHEGRLMRACLLYTSDAADDM